MSRGRPPLEDIRKHFEKIAEVDGRGQKTPRQKCNYCGNDTVDLIDRLKDHLIKCKRLPYNLKDSLSLITSKNQTNISDPTSPEEQSFDKIDADKKLAKFFYSTGINDRVKKLVALYQNLRVRKEISEDIWFENDEN